MMDIDKVMKIMTVIDDEDTDVVLAVDQDEFDTIVTEWPLMARINGHHMEATPIGEINGHESAGLVFDNACLTIMVVMP